jgi:hypothetical protein
MAKETSDGVPISDGFDFPVGPRGSNVNVFDTHKIDTVLVDPDYFQSLGYWHPGEDWNGRGGGDTDLGDPIYAVSNGKVIEFGHYSVWGNIVLLEHALPDGGRVWSQYAHLQTILVGKVGQKITRGQQIGTMGKGDKDRYIAHLHFEIRKKRLPISNWSPMTKDKNAVIANYYNPTDFIKTHRQLEIPEPVSPPITTQPVPPTVETTQVVQLVIDTQQSDPQTGGFFASQNEAWNKAAGGFRGDALWVPASARQQTYWGEWRPAIPSEGTWEVWVYIPKNNASTTYARYQVVHAAGQTEIAVNQSGNHGRWEILGAFPFAPGKGYVRLSNVTGEMTQTPLIVGYDTVCWTKIA